MSARVLTAATRAAFRGFGVAASSREVWRTYFQLVLAVLALAVVLAAAGIVGLYHALFHGMAREPPGILAALGLLAGGLVVLAVAPIVSLITVNLFAPLLGERLFLAGLRRMNPGRADLLSRGPGLPWASSAACNARRLLRLVLLTIACLALGLVPIAGIVLAPLAAWWVAATTLGWELLDPYLSLRGMRYREQSAFVEAHRAAVIGFALPYVPLLGVPLVGPFLVGFAHAAAAALVVDVIETAPMAQSSSDASGKSPS